MWGELPDVEQTVGSHGAMGHDQATLEEGGPETDCGPLGHAGRHGFLHLLSVQAATAHFHPDLRGPDHRLEQ